ncbi:F0F1 ATP synthase subunit B family protein [Roseicitreum antarcticum]|uniref:ATP synthase subunit b n=1 Tax=Roseicitreum antarcticum TaxID=564137 RepID=A0A1H2QT02_9RHOB|nr:ATP F0F1 synthase subunit B [Roseicitreum antarcticum]SDW10038.1 F-type H+-transporting ATPase subunit b [Roseicitreum antarcticum]
MKHILTTSLVAGFVAGTPAFAAVEGKPFFSLYNTDIVVAIAFVIFIGILVYYKVPGLLSGLLDKRADGIRADLDEARKLREEAQELRASFERKHVEVQAEAERIVASAKEAAEAAAAQAQVDLADSIKRRMKAAEDQIASAEAAAIRDVRNAAVNVAVAAAGDVIRKNTSAEDADAMIADSIKTVEAQLH